MKHSVSMQSFRNSRNREKLFGERTSKKSLVTYKRQIKKRILINPQAFEQRLMAETTHGLILNRSASRKKSTVYMI